ncbi:MAG: hypothetical protein ACOYLP_07920 [Flavobacterium sp.]|jgi:hypothetical protein|uniref:hypothetical protein n=1 Tax=Flavobacterium sp. TaxID=239 RepID=UPI003BBE297C
MNPILPDFLFPAVGYFENDSTNMPTIFTILEYRNQAETLYTAWFHENNKRSITVFKKKNMWFEKETNMETFNSKVIGQAIEIYNPYPLKFK